MVKFSAFADEVSTDFNNQVKFLVDQNLRAIEIRFVNQKNILDLTAIELSEVKDILTENDIEVSAIGSPVGKVKIDEPFSNHLDKFKHAVELAYFFNAPYIRVFSYYAPDGKNINEYREEVIHRMKIKAEILENSEIIMVHENESHIYGHSAENCLDLVKSVNSPNLKLAYDPANFVWGEKIANNMESCWPVMKPHVVHIHIKDWKLGNNEVGSLPGEGDGQIKQLLSELKDIDYRGYLTLEPHLKVGGQFGGETGPELFAEAVKATLAICDEIGLFYK